MSLKKELTELYLKFHADEVSAVAVHWINRDEAVAVSRHYVTVLLELKSGHVRSWRLKSATRRDYCDLCSDRCDGDEYTAGKSEGKNH